jgi:large subunit ribosomal protein L21
MYAIVEIAGHQYKVRKDQQLYVNRLEGKEGSKISFDQVLLTDDEGKVQVGAPVIKGTKVDAKIVEHTKADKVLVFKKKRRKGYQKLNGHRQYVTLLEITGFGKSTAKKTEAKKETAEAKKAAPKKAASPATAKKESKPKTQAKKAAPKTAAKKKAAPKKEASAKKDDK